MSRLKFGTYIRSASSLFNNALKSRTTLIMNTTPEDVTVVPVLPIPIEDLKLRTDVAFILQKLCVDITSIPVLSAALVERLEPKKDQLQLILVDHNKVDNSELRPLEHCVREIYDHHKNQQLYSSSTTVRQIETVGSCASLITLLFRDSGESFPLEVAELLLGAIVSDTVNLDRSKGRTFEKDEQAVAILSECTTTKPGELFALLSQAKFNCVGLSNRDLLRRDFKSFEIESDVFKRIGIAAVTQSFSKWVESEQDASDFLQAVRDFTAETRSDALLIMTLEVAPTFRRELLLYTKPEHFNVLVEKLKSLDLELTEMIEVNKLLNAESQLTALAWSQANEKISRKLLSPKLVEALKANSNTST